MDMYLPPAVACCSSLERSLLLFSEMIKYVVSGAEFL
jgi:hypothetical protein